MSNKYEESFPESMASGSCLIYGYLVPGRKVPTGKRNEKVHKNVKKCQKIRKNKKKKYINANFSRR